MISLRRRRSLFRATALPVFLEIQKPIRTSLFRPRRPRMTKSRWPADLPFRKTRSNSLFVLRVTTSLPKKAGQHQVLDSGGKPNRLRTSETVSPVFFFYDGLKHYVRPGFSYVCESRVLFCVAELSADMSSSQVSSALKAEDEYKNLHALMSSFFRLFHSYTCFSTSSRSRHCGILKLLRG